MARIKDFAKDLGIDIKEALELIEKAGLGSKQSGGSIENDEISTVLHVLTSEKSVKGIDKYLNGEKIIPSAKAKKKIVAEKKPEEKKPEVKTEAPKAEKKIVVDDALDVPSKSSQKPAEKKPEVKAEAPKAEKKIVVDGDLDVPSKSSQQSTEKKVEEKKVEEKKEAPKPQFEKKEFKPQQNGAQGGDKFVKQDKKPEFNGEKKPFNKDERPRFEKKDERQGGFDKKSSFDKSDRFEKKPFNKDGGFNKGGFNKDGFDKEAREPKYNVTPKQKKPQTDEPQVREIKTKTGATRVVDTRTAHVDLSKYDDNLDHLTSPYDSYGGSNKQKLKKQNNKDSFSSKKEKERQAMEKKKREAFEKAKNTQLSITVPDEITVGELATRLKVTSSEVVKRLFMMGVMASVNEVIDYDTAYLIADELGAKATKEVVVTIEEKLFEEEEDAPELLKERAPVVCVMGHVDHGKTSLLDAIRQTNVTRGEAGGITQHIGAYSVNINGKDITFLDTPGHEAFTAMRLRGAMATDIAIIVVAADDGIMPQTVEAINHAKAAGVDIIVAINKMDKPTANPDNIRQELTKYDLVPEEWGGDVMCIPVSAHTKMGLDDLLESVLLVAEVKELKANPDRLAKGIVIEAKLDKGRGPVATILVQNGTLHAGDVVIAGTAVGHVRAMTDHNRRAIKVAGPSVPVEITGLDEVPNAGDEFNAVKDEKMARELAEQRKAKAKEEIFKANAKVNLDDLFNQMSEGFKELNIIVKADVGGSCEAVKASLVKLSNAEVKVNVIHTAAGGITEGDVMLAAASNAIIVGFNVRPDKSAIDSAERQGVDIRTHRIIYEIIEEIEAAMKGMLAPTYKEVINGHAEVRQTIRVPSVGTIAGSYVQDGKILRSSQIRIIRDGVVIAEDKISSLRRFKDDVKEVAAGYECGVGLDRFNDIKEGDIMEAFTMEEVKR
ncbi:MAG: translation initiation factor IF-2 [Clostridia bacterium]|nr:translation initiation factor IF-2 [Clostridia bacterium]